MREQTELYPKDFPPIFNQKGEDLRASFGTMPDNLFFIISGSHFSKLGLLSGILGQFDSKEAAIMEWCPLRSPVTNNFKVCLQLMVWGTSVLYLIITWQKILSGTNDDLFIKLVYHALCDRFYQEHGRVGLRVFYNFFSFSFLFLYFCRSTSN